MAERAGECTWELRVPKATTVPRESEDKGPTPRTSVSGLYSLIIIQRILYTEETKLH